ncbi:phage protein [Pseudescherichia vulneris]|nr:phage protein [Pseudescherichia vulneris]
MQPKFRRGAARREKTVKEQLAAMTIIELVTTAHSYATSIQQIDTYSAIVTELASRLEALNIAYIRAMNIVRSAADDRAQQQPAAAVTEALQREQLTQAHKEGAYFVANRMLAAWEAGFIEDTAKNAADIARMILTSTEFMADAPEGDFDRSFADGVLEDIAAQLRNGEAV